MTWLGKNAQVLTTHFNATHRIVVGEYNIIEHQYHERDKSKISDWLTSKKYAGAKPKTSVKTPLSKGKKPVVEVEESDKTTGASVSETTAKSMRRLLLVSGMIHVGAPSMGVQTIPSRTLAHAASAGGSSLKSASTTQGKDLLAKSEGHQAALQPLSAAERLGPHWG